MNILSSTLKDTKLLEGQCCVCNKTFNLYFSLEYVITKSGLCICDDCIDRLAQENKRRTNF